MAQGHKTGGREKGTPNKITTVFKDAVRVVYEDIGGHAAFATWARENPTEFYRIASRLIPSEVNVKADNSLTVIVDRGTLLSPDVPTLPHLVKHQDAVLLPPARGQRQNDPATSARPVTDYTPALTGSSKNH